MAVADLPVPPGQPMLVIVSGRPGAGKSTLARRLADALSCPVVSRDEIHDGLLRTLARGPVPAGKEAVAKLAFDAFFRVLELYVSCRVTVVAEAAFQDLRWRIGLEPLLPRTELRIIHCEIDANLAGERVAHRRLQRPEEPPAWPGSARRRAGTGSHGLRPFTPLSLPVPSLAMSTADGYDPRLEEVVAFLTSGKE